MRFNGPSRELITNACDYVQFVAKVLSYEERLVRRDLKTVGNLSNLNDKNELLSGEFFFERNFHNLISLLKRNCSVKISLKAGLLLL